MMPCNKDLIDKIIGMHDRRLWGHQKIQSVDHAASINNMGMRIMNEKMVMRKLETH